MKQVISHRYSNLSKILRILTLGIIASLVNACGEMSVFLAVQKNPAKITNVELDSEGHFTISLKKDSRSENSEMEFYVQKQATLPNAALSLASSLDGVSGMAFEATQIESSLAPSKTMTEPSGVTPLNSWTFPETIDSNLYYLIEVKSKQKSIKAAMTYMVIARAALAPVQGIQLKEEDKIVTLNWTASPYANSYIIYRDEGRKQILASTEDLTIRFDRSLVALPEKVWLEARRGTLASRILSPASLRTQEGEGDDARGETIEESTPIELPVVRESVQVLLNSVTGVAFTGSFSSTPSVSFSWNKSSDSRVRSYGVKICRSANCLTSCSDVISLPGLSHSLTGIDGASYFACVRGEDGLGNYSNFVHSNNPITIDTVAPTTSTVSIAEGSEYIKGLATTLTLSAIAADEMYVTENSNCSSGGTWERYTNSKAWTFSHANSGNSIYAKFRDYAGNESPCATDTVIHDNQSPTAPSVVINDGDTVTGSAAVSLTLAASDASPLEVYVTNDPSCASGGFWESFVGTKAWELEQTESSAAVYVKFRDAALNLSACVSASIVHDSLLLERQ
jgi:hypothetical protein